MTYSKPTIEKWNAVAAIQNNLKKPGVERSDTPITEYVGTMSAYQADE